ncbi:hypothetical protein J4772_06280 [Cohnella sp. LGH]|uniref:hypothetical protein n=1 Tax=Cohnella sp. LGH TaxID=1619153 RepID=UPI001ADA6CA5|nr:hypothetical protein [Cohnella sp. LGH]QTH44009.1 hypothetical protein J4772_06280 [Cohnella sp. LGH]
MDKSQSAKAGHYEIIGETYAKVEFFEQGWNPYSRFLDIDKVDLILRKRIENKTVFKEIQVKFGKLHIAATEFEQKFFDFTSWKITNPNEFDNYIDNDNLFIVYVLSKPNQYEGDIFIFPVKEFSILLKQAIPSKEKVKLYISHSINEDKWYIRKLSKFKALDDTSVVDVTQYRRNFNILT